MHRQRLELAGVAKERGLLDGDAAQLRQSGSVVVSSTGQQETGGAAFNPSSFYSYTLDPAANVPARVRTYAGPQPDIGI